MKELINQMTIEEKSKIVTGGSGMGKTNEKLLPSCKGAKLLDGRVLKANVKVTDSEGTLKLSDFGIEIEVADDKDRDLSIKTIEKSKPCKCRVLI